MVDVGNDVGRAETAAAERKRPAAVGPTERPPDRQRPGGSERPGPALPPLGPQQPGASIDPARLQAAYGNAAVGAVLRGDRRQQLLAGGLRERAEVDSGRPYGPTELEPGLARADQQRREVMRSDRPEFERYVDVTAGPSQTTADTAGLGPREPGAKDRQPGRGGTGQPPSTINGQSEPDEEQAGDQAQPEGGEEVDADEQAAEKAQDQADGEVALDDVGEEPESGDPTQAPAVAGTPGAERAANALASLGSPIAESATIVTSPVVFGPSPDESSANPSIARTGAQRRMASQRVAADFVDRNAGHAENLLALSLTAPARILARSVEAQTAVDAAVAAGLGAVDTAINAAIGTTRGRAARAEAEIRKEHATTLSAILKSAAEAAAEVEKLYASVCGELDTLETGQNAAITALYRKWIPKLEAAGTEVGGEAKAKAETYAKARLSELNGESSILDGPIHDNRKKARAKAAREVGKAYAAEFEKAAKKQAGQVSEGEQAVLEYVTTSADQARLDLSTHKDDILESLNTSRDGYIDQIDKLTDRMISGIRSSRTVTVSTLEAQRVADRARITGYGETQKAAVDDQAGQAIEALLDGTGRATTAFNHSLRGFLESAPGMQTPDREELEPILAEVQAETDALGSTLYAQLDMGITASEGGVVAGGEQAASAIEQLGASGVEQAKAGAAGYAQSVAQMLAAATKGFNQLRAGQVKTAAAVKTSAKTGFDNAAKSLRETFTALATNTVESFKKAKTQLTEALRKDSLPSVDGDVVEQADKAAKAVQPRWKSVVKWVITIVVIIAVVALTIVSAGSLGVVGTILLGAALGAAAGAATTIGHNLVDGKKWSAGVGKAMVIGAIGGAFGGIGGAIAGKVASTGLKFAIETGVDAVGGVLGDLAVGNAITAEGILFGAAMGAAVGGGLGIAGKLKGKIKIKPTADVAVAAPKPRVDVAASSTGRPKSRTRRLLERTTILKKTPDVPVPSKPSVEPGETGGPATPVGPKPEPTRPLPAEPRPIRGDRPAGRMLPDPDVLTGKVAEPAPINKTIKPEEPGLVAKTRTSDGHEIKVTRDGRLVRCSDCDLDAYADVLANDAALAARADDVKKRLASEDEAVAAQAREEFSQLKDELEARLKAESVSSSGASPSADAGAEPVRGQPSGQPEVLAPVQPASGGHAPRPGGAPGPTPTAPRAHLTDEELRQQALGAAARHSGDGGPGPAAAAVSWPDPDVQGGVMTGVNIIRKGVDDRLQLEIDRLKLLVADGPTSDTVRIPNVDDYLDELDRLYQFSQGVRLEPSVRDAIRRYINRSPNPGLVPRSELVGGSNTIAGWAPGTHAEVVSVNNALTLAREADQALGPADLRVAIVKTTEGSDFLPCPHCFGVLGELGIPPGNIVTGTGR